MLQGAQRRVRRAGQCKDRQSGRRKLARQFLRQGKPPAGDVPVDEEIPPRHGQSGPDDKAKMDTLLARTRRDRRGRHVVLHRRTGHPKALPLKQIRQLREVDRIGGRECIRQDKRLIARKRPAKPHDFCQFFGLAEHAGNLGADRVGAVARVGRRNDNQGQRKQRHRDALFGPGARGFTPRLDEPAPQVPRNSGRG
ncbi:MAG: hypothetical protein E6H67_00640 [Betaproteobacteria bacterium]|nr:MAG: hypothetical protein E6H67_00640 [Betaproteobacteria bacterium]